MTALIFEKVTGTDNQVAILYKLLQQREKSISHAEMPGMESHRQFVQSPPYMDWYIIFTDKSPIGSVYVQADNSIGMNLISARKDWVAETLKFVTKNCPLQPPIPSKVPPYFFVNIPASDQAMANILREMNMPPIQISYKIASDEVTSV